jgi:hypothetical protein
LIEGNKNGRGEVENRRRGEKENEKRGTRTIKIKPIHLHIYEAYSENMAPEECKGKREF